ncbi:MAG: ATP-NAD kinase family protein [Candidatus Hodarchaeales archaeon]|jgi:predicted polyphosphate/ATP-dependent NAD kinase
MIITIKVGLIINPIAGMGGRVGLKGTDGSEILEQARLLGAKPESQNRTQLAIKKLLPIIDKIEVITYPEEMGGNIGTKCGFHLRIIGSIAKGKTTAEDTQKAAKDLLDLKVDLLLFAGGDGTARNIYDIVKNELVTLGIPTGVKIQSGVFARNPSRAGELALSYLQKRTRVREAEVMDIDESLFRKGIVRAKLYGYLKIPYERTHVQSSKAGSPETDSFAHQAIAEEVIQNMESNYFYIVGPGTTTRAIMEKLKLPNTLLGIDLIHNKKLIANDLNESSLSDYIQGNQTRLIITPIGGQGYLLGRGNQQISPDIIKNIGKDNIIAIATRNKLNSLNGQPLLVDTGDKDIDNMLCGYIGVITGYREKSIYPVSC